MLYFYLLMEQTLSFNEILYLRRIQMGLSKRKFAKFLGIPSLFYSYFEKGYVKPSKKYIDRISKALDIDYNQYFEGLASYPGELPEEETRFEKWYKNLLAKLWVRIVFIVLFLGSILTIVFGFQKYNHTMNHANEFYSEKYIEFVNQTREKGTITFSLLHEITRPEIHTSDDEKYVSISTSTEEYSIRSLTAYINYKDENSSLYYIVPNLASTSLVQLNVQYVDYPNLTKYISSFSIENLKFAFNGTISLEDGTSVDETSDTYKIVKEKMLSHVDDVNSDFTQMIKTTLGMDYDFYSELLVDHQKGATQNLMTEILSLGMGIIGIGLTGLFLFAYLYALFFGQKKKKATLNNNVIVENESVQVKTEKRVFPEVKNDMRFFPFIPETVFEIVGIILILFGSIRVILNTYYLFFSDGINEELYSKTSSNFFLYFTIGMFLLYFIDFDIFLNDRRSLRNFFLYGIIFFGLYSIECILLDYLSKTRGVITIASEYYIVPNNFGTISCYFGIMFFLFYNPKWLNTKKKTIIFRLCSIIPILWILISSLIFQNYKNWHLDFNSWQIYFFDSERPQFSFLCVSYLIGLYFMRLFVEKKYGKKVAKKIYNGNKFYFCKNVLICLIIGVIAIFEFALRNSTTNIKGIGRYWQIVFLIPSLFFYHPHLGKRCKPVDYLTLALYALFFCVGYVFAAIIILAMVIR